MKPRRVIMEKTDIVEYVMHTPHNTNSAVLNSMLNELLASQPAPVPPEPQSNIIWIEWDGNTTGLPTIEMGEMYIIIR